MRAEDGKQETNLEWPYAYLTLNGVLVCQPLVDLHIGSLVPTNTHTDTTY